VESKKDQKRRDNSTRGVSNQAKNSEAVQPRGKKDGKREVDESRLGQGRTSSKSAIFSVTNQKRGKIRCTVTSGQRTKRLRDRLFVKDLIEFETENKEVKLRKKGGS